MNKRICVIIAMLAVVLSMCGCGKEVKEETIKETEKATVATEADTLPTEKIPEIDKENGVPETEPEVNKAIIVTAPATEPTEAADGTKPTEEDASDETSVTIPAEEVGTPVEETTAYENLMAMSGEDQKAFMESFGSMDKFFAWLEAAKAEHDAIKAPIEIGSDGVVNIG